MSLEANTQPSSGQPNVGRRRFLTRLFQPEAEAASALVPVAVSKRRGSGVFWAMEADADGAVYLAGDDGLVFRHDGKTWQREASGSENNIHALCYFEDCVYSAGWLGQICVRRDGQWQPQQGGGDEALLQNYPLFDIAACSEGVWAVGDHGRVTRLVDQAWCEETVPTTANLRCVLPMEDGRVLAGGLGGVLLEHVEGGWREIATNTGCALVSIAAIGEDSFVIAGGEYSVADGEFVGRLFLLSEGEFSEVDTPGRLPRLRRVRRYGEQLLVVGDGGVAYRWTASGVVPVASRARYDFHDVLVLANQMLLVCGDSETLLQETSLVANEQQQAVSGCQWEQIAETESGAILRALLSPATGQLIAAGDGGEVLHLDGEKIERKCIPGGFSVHALWGSSPRNVLAACDQATIAHYDGESWSIVHQGEQDVPFLALTGFGPHDVFAVGDAGLAVRYDGLMWRQLESGTRQEIYGLWGADSNHLLAVGGGGLVLRFDGDRWKSFTAGTEQDLYAVHGLGLQKLFLAGLAGTVVRFEDNAWHREFTGVRADLHALASDEQGRVYAAGSNGTVLRLNGEYWEPEESGVNITLQSLLCVGSEVYAAGASGMLLRRLRK